MNNLNSQAVDRLEFDLIIPRRSNAEILVAGDHNDLALPRISIPKWERTAQKITERTLQLWNLPTVYLFQPETGSPNGEANEHTCVILESRDPNWEPPDGLRWVSRKKLCQNLHSIETSTIEKVLETADAHNKGALDGPFARIGWFDELISWAQKQIDPRQLTLTGKFRQLNGGPFFSLVRLGTTSTAVWFKAVGEPNPHEFPITIALAKNFPGYIPTIIATHPSWNAWLTLEVEGSMLDEKSDLATWVKAARSLANLQIESVRKTPELLDAGCRDIRMPVLLDQIDPFFEVVAELMEKQPKVPPPVLSRRELRVLGVQLKEACSRFEELWLPDTLGHLDFNPGNIIAAPNGCVFLDWAEAYVGHPFFTFEYLREHLSHTHSGNVAWESKVTACYIEPWTSLMSVAGIFQTLEFAPLVAVLAYALGNNTWRHAQRLENPKVAGCFRSLTRRMQREVKLLEDRREQCLG